MSTTQPLYRLPNGDWIELLRVFAISPREQDKGYPILGPRVDILTSGCQLTVRFDTFEAARAWADEFAELVNKARTANVAALYPEPWTTTETDAALEART